MGEGLPMRAMISHFMHVAVLTTAWIVCIILTLISETLWLQATALVFAFAAFGVMVMLATTLLFYDDLKDR